MKRGLQAGWVVGTSVFLAMGCGGYGSDDKDTAPSAKVTASASEVMIGSTIELNAAGSVYDSLLWSINQTAISACDDHELCILTMDTAGTFEIALDATTSATKRATVTVQVVDNPTAKKASASTASTAAAAGSSSTAFSTPNDVAGLKLWLDASDSSTLFQNSDCSTTPVVSNNDPVGCIKDKKSGGTPYHFTQSTAGYRPLYKTNSLNSKPVIHTDGSDDNLITGVLTDTSGGKEDLKFTNATFFIVSKESNLGSNNNGIVSCGPQSGSDYGSADGIVFSNSAPANTVEFFRDFSGSNQLSVRQSVSSSAYNIMTLRLNGGTAHTWKDGGARLTESYSDVTQINPYKCIIGDRLNNGAADAGANTNGANDYAEIIIYDQALSDSDRQQIETYLANKWGLTKASKEVFEPTDIAGTQLWLDSSDISTLFTDSACSTAITANNDPVGCWKDKKGSGTAYNFTQSTAGYRPSYLTNTINGLPVISTDNGNSTYLITGDLRDTTGGKVDMKFTNPSIFVATAIKTISTSFMGIFSCSSNIQSDDASPDGFIFQANPVNQVAINRYNGSADSIGFSISSIGSTITDMTMVLNSGTASLWNKGLSVGTDAYSDTTEINPYKCLIGARMNNSGGVTSPYGRNHYSEVLIYNQPLTTVQREQMTAYLHTKWGIR